MNIKKPILSVIVPIYNRQKYLEDCIESILNQTFRDFELILVNDGSTDDSGMICEKYALTDSRIKIIHKKNGGVASARNAGLDVAKGEYLSFIDSDDKISLDLYEKNISILLNDKSIDFVKFPLYYMVGDKIIKDIQYNSSHINNVKEALLFWTSKGSGVRGYVWENIYKASIFRELRFREGMIYEDCYIQGFILEQIKHIYLSNYGKYYYIQHPDSLIRSKETLKKSYDDLEATITYMDKMKDFDLINHQYFIHCVTNTTNRAIRMTVDFPEGDFFPFFNRMKSYSFSLVSLIKAQLPIKYLLKMILIRLLGIRIFLNIIHFLHRKELKDENCSNS